MIRSLTFFVSSSLLFMVTAYPANTPNTSPQLECRHLHTDSTWPDINVWGQLNQTVGGRLIRGLPLGQPCYSHDSEMDTCVKIQDEWTSLETLLVLPHRNINLQY